MRWVRLDPAGEQLIDIKLLQVRQGFAVCPRLMGLRRVQFDGVAACWF